MTAEGRSRRSRLLWEVDRWAGQPVTALAVLAAAAVWVLLSVIFDFPGRWEQILQALVAAIIVTMVFVIQQTTPPCSPGACHQSTTDQERPGGRPGRSSRSAGQDWMKASRSGLSTSACVTGIPCGYPG